MSAHTPAPAAWRTSLADLVKLKAEIARADARYVVPPCLECGAETPKQAETVCRCGGDKDDCHGQQLWPD